MGRYQEAIAYYDKALEIDLRLAEAWYNKGVALGEEGRHRQAVDCYDKARAIDDRFLEVWYKRAISLDALGRHEEAIASYREATVCIKLFGFSRDWYGMPHEIMYKHIGRNDPCVCGSRKKLKRCCGH